MTQTVVSLNCPFCDLSRIYPLDKFPPKPVNVTCSKCNQKFTFTKHLEIASTQIKSVNGPTETTYNPRLEGATTLAQLTSFSKTTPSSSQLNPINSQPYSRKQSIMPTSTSISSLPVFDKMEPATFMQRGIAVIIDFLIPGFICLLIAYVCASLFLPAVNQPMMIRALIGFKSGAYTGIITIIINAVVLVFWVIPVMCEASKLQATIGKKIVGIYVIGTDGKQISFKQSLVRNSIKDIMNLIPILQLSIYFEKNKRGLHDLVASTMVVTR